MNFKTKANNMTIERFKWYQAEIARLQGVDKRRSEYVDKLWSEEQKCTLPGCCNMENWEILSLHHNLICGNGEK